MSNIDILAIGAHPDDVELAASGTLLLARAQRKRIGLLDLTRGELGSRGTSEIRATEAGRAAEMLQVEFRENAELPDGFLLNNREQQMAVVRFLRKHRPRIVLCNALADRHPDHGKAASLVSDACFLSGLKALHTHTDAGEPQEAWRPDAVYHYIQDRYIKPDFVVDISPYFRQKIEVIMAFSSQFYTGKPQAPEEVTPISTPEFMEFLEARAREFGRNIGVEFGEGFNTERPIGVSDLFKVL